MAQAYAKNVALRRSGSLWMMMHFFCHTSTLYFSSSIVQDGFSWNAYRGGIVGLFPHDRQGNCFSKHSQCSNV